MGQASAARSVDLTEAGRDASQTLCLMWIKAWQTPI
jgi:hypothetical protein